ncbi:hypothetical protein [Actinoplanes sp. NPDC026670]|uniref:hypothetical protein n=1 Tax=Actinoplanes sp. NPDC026670 TaxID=3154700 RepID=UPI0033FCE2F4
MNRSAVIPASGSYLAVYQSPHTDDGTFSLPIEGWAADGRALVLEAELGRVIPAGDRPGFLRVEPTPARCVAVLPAPGWHVQWPHDGQRMPLLGWVVDEQGRVTALAADSEDLYHFQRWGADQVPLRYEPPGDGPVNSPGSRPCNRIHYFPPDVIELVGQHTERTADDRC